jgi:hypothetical protein
MSKKTGIYMVNPPGGPKQHKFSTGVPPRGARANPPDHDDDDEDWWYEEDDDEIREESDLEPEEHDGYITDRPFRGYDVSMEGKFLGNVTEYDDAEQLLREQAHGFWPNVWFIDDHGGHRLVEMDWDVKRNPPAEPWELEDDEYDDVPDIQDWTENPPDARPMGLQGPSGLSRNPPPEGIDDTQTASWIADTWDDRVEAALPVAQGWRRELDRLRTNAAYWRGVATGYWHALDENALYGRNVDSARKAIARSGARDVEKDDRDVNYWKHAVKNKYTGDAGDEVWDDAYENPPDARPTGLQGPSGLSRNPYPGWDWKLIKRVGGYEIRQDEVSREYAVIGPQGDPHIQYPIIYDDGRVGWDSIPGNRRVLAAMERIARSKTPEEIESDRDAYFDARSASEEGSYGNPPFGGMRDGKPRYKLGSGGRFAACVKKMEQQKDVDDPEGLCASIGRRKYGKKRFDALAKRGRKRK